MSDLHVHKTFRERRKALKVGQSALARAAGISRFTLIEMEKGTANPSVGTVTKVEQVLKELEMKEKRNAKVQAAASH